MKFHERFDIEVGLDEAQRRFANRLQIALVHGFYFKLADNTRFAVQNAVGYALGVDDGDHYVRGFNKATFLQNLRTIEAVYQYFSRSNGDHYANVNTQRGQIHRIILDALSESETDLGIEWRDGIFIRKGANFSTTN